MNLFLDAMNAAKNLNQNVNNIMGGGGNKQEKLRNQITVCTYPDEAKYIIQKSVKQVFHVYPFFESQILTFPQNNVQKKYLQLKAILQIQVKGKVCKVDYNMMIPYAFPNKSPYVRIINRNAQYNVDPFYKSLRSPTDAKSFILNQKLNEIASWNSSKSLVSIIIQSQDLFRKRFPFTKPHEHNSGLRTQEGWGNSPWQQQQSGFNQQILNQVVNQGFNNQGFQGYNNQVFNQGFDNRGYINNQGYNNQGYNPNQYNQPPISFGGQNNVSNIIAGAQKSAGLAKQKLQLMKLEHTKTLQKIQNLEILSYSLKSESQFLQRQNMDMTEFLKKNEGNAKENLTTLIKPADGLSQQILDLISSIKARQDTVTLLQSKFTNQSISFDEFLKNLRKIEEQKFDEKALLNKCTSMKNY